MTETPQRCFDCRSRASVTSGPYCDCGGPFINEELCVRAWKAVPAEHAPSNGDLARSLLADAFDARHLGQSANDVRNGIIVDEHTAAALDALEKLLRISK